MMQVPSVETLEEEWLCLANKLIGNDSIYLKEAMLHAACIMSCKYTIDIRKFMWNVCGQKCSNAFLTIMDEHNVKYHISIT